MTPSAVALADEWIPVRPGTDAAQMPPGLEREESYKEYVFGFLTPTARTPEVSNWEEV